MDLELEKLADLHKRVNILEYDLRRLLSMVLELEANMSEFSEKNNENKCK